MKQNVYVGGQRNQQCGDLISLELEPLLPMLKTLYKDTPCADVLTCYAFLEQAKNTFVFKAPFDLDVRYTNDERIFCIDNINLTQEDFNDTVLMRTPQLLQLFTGFGFAFFTDKSTVMSLHKASHHVSDKFNFPLMGGSFDISSWFRHVHPAVINTEQKDFSLKRGDPLMYIKFHTKNTVELKPFHMTEELQRIACSSNKVAVFSPKKPLSSLYKMFNRTRAKNIILKTIKEQYKD